MPSNGGVLDRMQSPMCEQGRCPVCAGGVLSSFVKRKEVPVHQNQVMRSEREAIEVRRGEIDLLFCHGCGFIFNQKFDASLLSYGSTYDNSQIHSSCYKEYLDELSNFLVYELGIQNRRLIEVGCGNGYFLRKLISREGAGNIGFGFDPSYQGPDSVFDGRLRFFRSFFNEDAAKLEADVVICRHVIEHVQDPVGLLSLIRTALNPSSQSIIFMETPCVEWILRTGAFWDFFYEHCSYFSASSLTAAAQIAGFRFNDIYRSFGDQYLVATGNLATDRSSEFVRIDDQEPSLKLASEYSVNEQCLLTSYSNKIRRIADNGGVAFWGAAAKGVTLANLIDPHRSMIDCLVDLNPNKQGCFAPGSGHPIVNPSELPHLGVKSAVVVNQNYFAENLEFVQTANLDVELFVLETLDGTVG